jgi:hypothetical protein
MWSLGIGVWWSTSTSLISSLLSKLKARSTYFENQACTKVILKELDSEGLLEKASIITTPTAYSDGVLHSVKPEQTLSELVTNGGFDTSIPLGNAGSGWNFIDSNNAGSSGEYYQGGIKLTRTTNLSRLRPFVGNTTSISFFPLETRNYVVSYDLISTTDSSKTVSMSAGGQSVPLPGTVGSHTVYFENGGTSNICQISPGNNTDIVLDNISIKEVIDADFTFTRNSPATRVNSQGLLQNVQILGSNVVTNGDFATNADWTAGDGWSFGGNKASCDGTQTNVTNLIQTISTNIQNQLVKISFTLDISAGTLSGSLNNSGGAEFDALTTSGNYSVEATSGDVNPTILFQGDANFIGSISNVVIEPVTDDTDLPRIDYRGGCGSWLLEPQATNTATDSNDFTTGDIFLESGNPGVDNGILTSAQATSPDGTNNAWKLVDNNDGNVGVVSLRYYSANVIADNYNTVSLFVKKQGDNDWFYIVLASFDFPSQSAYFNISNGTLGDVGADVTTSIDDYGNGWYRCSITFQTEIDTIGAVQFRLATNNGQGSITRDGTNGAYIYGLQAESDSTRQYATSYIPTSGDIQTRGADLATDAGSSDLISSTEGVFYLEVAALTSINNYESISLSNGGFTERIRFLLNNTENRMSVELDTGNGSGFFRGVVLSDITAFNKIAIKYKQDDYAIWVNGIKEHFNLSGAVPTLNELNFTAGGDTGSPFKGNVKCVAVFKEALTDAELAALTTI